MARFLDSILDSYRLTSSERTTPQNQISTTRKRKNNLIYLPLLKENGVKREIKEETGCDILQTGILEIGNKVLENDIFLSIIFGAKLIDEKLDYNLNEILDVKWFSYDEIIKMKSKLRSPEIILRCIENYKAGKTVNLDVLNIL